MVVAVTFGRAGGWLMFEYSLAAGRGRFIGRELSGHTLWWANSAAALKSRRDRENPMGAWCESLDVIRRRREKVCV